jgi:predicted HTH domain antitoxin
VPGGQQEHISQPYKQVKLSLGQAAELAGLTKRSFAELLAKCEVSIFNFSASVNTKNIANV